MKYCQYSNTFDGVAMTIGYCVVILFAFFILAITVRFLRMAYLEWSAGADAYDEGFDWAKKGESLGDCQFDRESQEYKKFVDGYLNAREEGY